MSAPVERAASVARCTCGCGKTTSADYWHAWQAGRSRGWSEGINRPAWWLRLRFRVGELLHRLAHAKGDPAAPDRLSSYAADDIQGGGAR